MNHLSSFVVSRFVSDNTCVRGAQDQISSCLVSIFVQPVNVFEVRVRVEFS